MTPLLRFERVRLRRGGRLLVDDMSFELEPGECLQVTGPNGIGKTSLIRLAAGLLHPERGMINRSPLALADDGVALDRELPLELALRFWVPTADEEMDALGLAHLARVPVRFLSSGQLKRAALARVAASQAPLWLLDEPLNGLDSDGAARLSTRIGKHLKGGGAILAASHQPLPGKWLKLELTS